MVFLETDWIKNDKGTNEIFRETGLYYKYLPSISV